MKNMKTMILVALCVVLSICVGVMGTIAYLTDTETITNTMTVGNIAITLDEAKVNQYGQKLNAEGAIYSDGDIAAERVTSNDYKLIPGHTYTKDPIIHVQEGSEVCYVFVKIVNGLENMEAEGNKISEQLAANGWKQHPTEENIWFKETAVDAREGAVDVAVFQSFTIAQDADNEPEWNNGGNITITAYAVQADGFNSAEKAWEAASGAFQMS